MKKFIKTLSILALSVLSVLGLAACKTTTTLSPEQIASILADAKATAVAQVNKLDDIEGAYDEAVVNAVKALVEDGVEAVQAATTAEEAQAAVTACKNAVTEYLEGKTAYASGAYSYVASSYEERTEILGILEEYAVEAGLTGLTLFQSAGYALYNEGVQLGTNTYIVGYGFGAISEGGITQGLSYEGINPNYTMYYHTYESEDPKTINYGNDKGSVVGDLQPYISESYWGTKMNETKDGYEWYNSLALEKPQAVANGDEVTDDEGEILLATEYKFNVRTGSALKYSTLSSNSTLAAYNNREVQPEDYITPFKLLWTGKNAWARALDNEGSSGEIVGATAYYNASSDGFNEEAWENVGIKIEDEDQDGIYTLHFTFITPCTPFYAMYYLSSSIYAPIPQSFIDDIGGASVYGNFDTEAGLTPVDTTLSTGAFVLESWTSDSEIVFKKNANFNEEGRFNVAGVHIAILKGIATDKELAFKEFMAGKLSACSVPSTQLENFMTKTTGVSDTDSSVKYYVKQTNGGSTYKLNFNTCDQETWESLFGEDGSITQTDAEDAWECEPIMANHDFYLGLSYALNRQGLADKLGCAYSMDYFGDVYLSDPENGVAYNTTEAHKSATSSLRADTDGDGYDVEIARTYFRKACEAELAAGHYQEGDTITIEIAWMYSSDEEEYHNYIKQCFESAFNDLSVCNGKLTLEVVFWVGSSWSDVYYNKMMVGQFDIGFGAISGNSLNPLNFLEVLRSDNSSGFTLNWGVDTSVVDPELVYDGVCWSFDSLWIAADQGGYFTKSVSSKPYNVEFIECVANEDGSQTIKVQGNFLVEDGVEISFSKACIFAYDSSVNYCEEELTGTYDATTDVLSIVVPAEIIAEFAESNLYTGSIERLLAYGYAGIDFYFNCKFKKINSESYQTVSCWFNTDAE